MPSRAAWTPCHPPSLFQCGKDNGVRTNLLSTSPPRKPLSQPPSLPPALRVRVLPSARRHHESSHDIFHVSQLKKCLRAPIDVVLPEVAPLDTDLTYPEHPIKILDQKSRVTRHKTIKFYKIQWSNHTEGEATWESEDFLRPHHLEFKLS
jgi:hypothetical protein